MMFSGQLHVLAKFFLRKGTKCIQFVTVKTMKTVSWIGGKVPFILNLGTL